MRLVEIDKIKKSLDTLAKEPATIAYELAKNIRLCDAILTEANSIAQTIHNGFADKDADGKLIVYREEETGKDLYKITDPAKAALFTTEMQKLETEEHNIPFVKIKRSQIKNMSILPTVLLPLIDCIIVDDEI